MPIISVIREVKVEVLGRAGRYQEVAGNLKVKEVWVEDRRYIVCCNPQEAAKDAAERQAILKSLKDKLKQGAKSVVGNWGYKRFLKVEKGAVSLDAAAVAAEARVDGKYVLCTNPTLPAAEVAMQYKRLYLVEQLFRAAKSLVDTRPIFHQWDATIKGHVFCSFLALVLLDEPKRRLSRRGWQLEWADIRRDLATLMEEELADIREGAQALGLTPEQALEHLGQATYNINLNDVAYWRNLPEKVWNYYIGGYQIIKKWLSYREKALLGHPLTPDEAREVTHMARRLAAIVLLEPALNSNYQRIKARAYAWPRQQG